MTDISCPVCGAGFDLAVAFACDEERQAFARLASVSIPLGTRVLRYIGLFQPPKQRLTSAKKLKLLQQLLPDLERGAITWKGRDWPAPVPAWCAAIDQLLSKRSAATLDLPLKGHGYLYAVIASSADRIEAQAEHQREADRAAAARARAHSSGQPTDAGQLLQAPAPAQPQPPRPASTPIYYRVAAARFTTADAIECTGPVGVALSDSGPGPHGTKPRAACGWLRGAQGGDGARAGGIQHKADGIGTGGDGSIDILLARQAADLDAGAC